MKTGGVVSSGGAIETQVFNTVGAYSHTHLQNHSSRR